MFGRFKPVRQLGIGAMAVVHLAHDVLGHRDVALKRMHRVVPVMVERFKREYRALAGIRHLGVPAIFDIGESESGEPYFTMEVVTGETLELHIRRGPVEPVRALTLAIELGRVLMAVHAAGVVHRDVKPSNVIIEPGDRVRLLDFGICCLTEDYYRQPHLRGVTAEAERWQTLDVRGLGNEHYVDPQLATVGTSPQNDVFSVCVILYELVTGRPLFDSDARRFGEIDEAEFRPALAPLVTELRRGVAEPLSRHRSMAELVKALEVVRGRIVGPLAEQTRAATPAPPAPPRAWVASLLCLALGGLGGAAIGRLASPSEREPSPVAVVSSQPTTSPALDISTPPPSPLPASAAPSPANRESPPPTTAIVEPARKPAAKLPETFEGRIRHAEARARRCLMKANAKPRPLDVTIAADKPPSVWGAASESPEARCIREALAHFKLTVVQGQRQHTFFEET
ncbi:serine/threonine-protein kinase [Nannocystis bainbridge]|uniref:Serine/threonine-protein kinase n=1 Tax=Nannocystis bainbridge TaxID=2995303 RepID=A0ABT5E4Q5_9BACT|nr:serine/threonine-protein kinase [Nannocystis bainbridge]MDC0720851.1 serine/threonine-protein kinase [Nannocystis bainbridge]